MTVMTRVMTRETTRVTTITPTFSVGHNFTSGMTSPVVSILDVAAINVGNFTSVPTAFKLAARDPNESMIGSRTFESHICEPQNKIRGVTTSTMGFRCMTLD